MPGKVSQLVSSAQQAIHGTIRQIKAYLPHSNKHTVFVRDESATVDVTSLDNVTWESERGVYKVESRVPPVKQQALESSPQLKSQFSVERRADGMYLTEQVEDPDSALAVSRLMERFE